MGNANTLEDGLMNLMKRISAACGNIWDFKLSSDPDNEFQVKVIEDSTTEQPVSNLLNKKSDLSYLKKEGACITPNGALFKTDSQGFLANMMETMYKERVKFKQKEIKA